MFHRHLLHNDQHGLNCVRVTFFSSITSSVLSFMHLFSDSRNERRKLLISSPKRDTRWPNELTHFVTGTMTALSSRVFNLAVFKGQRIVLQSFHVYYTYITTDLPRTRYNMEQLRTNFWPYLINRVIAFPSFDLARNVCACTMPYSKWCCCDVFSYIGERFGQ